MNISGLLDSLLKNQGAGGGSLGGGLGNSLGGLLGGGAKGGSTKGGTGSLRDLATGDFGKGALAGGALGLLLGKNRTTRKLATYGGLAAIGVMAYKAYGDYQRQQGAAHVEPRTVDRLPDAEADVHSRAILTALVGAAKADGHVDDRERAVIEGEFTRLIDDAPLQQWLQAELARPLDPAEIARAADTPEMASEMYLASALVVDEQSYMERAYLDELARQLKIDDALKTRLEAQVRDAAAG